MKFVKIFKLSGAAVIIVFRELLANTKAAAQLAIHDRPAYLGPEIPIWGDGRATKDKI